MKLAECPNGEALLEIKKKSRSPSQTNRNDTAAQQKTCLYLLTLKIKLQQ